MSGSPEDSFRTDSTPLPCRQADGVRALPQNSTTLYSCYQLRPHTEAPSTVRVQPSDRHRVSQLRCAFFKFALPLVCGFLIHPIKGGFFIWFLKKSGFLLFSIIQIDILLWYITNCILFVPLLHHFGSCCSSNSTIYPIYALLLFRPQFVIFNFLKKETPFIH